jgi:type I restriction-modification system DNA methylase subunit
MDHKKELENLIKITSGRYSMHDIFSDFVEMSALSISNTVDHWRKDFREDRYLQIAKKYNRSEVDNICRMLSELAKALEAGFSDVLGQVYMELGLGSKETGQFFTPYNICKLMSRLSLDTADFANGKAVSLNEPTCGSGANIIAFAENLKVKGINYQDRLRVVAQDLDFRAVHMCYVQLSLLGVPAMVIQGNTLTEPPTSLTRFSKNVYYTPLWVLKGSVHERR